MSEPDKAGILTTASNSTFTVKILTLEEQIEEWVDIWCRGLPSKALEDLAQRMRGLSL